MAKNVQKGNIANVSAKDFIDKQSGEPIVLYSFQIEGSNRWFRTGKDPLPFGKGENVQFVVNGQNVDVSSMEKVEGPVQQAPAPSRSASSAATGSGAASVTRSVSRDEYWANKEKRDLEKDERYQNVDIPRMTMSTAVGSAATVVAAALEHDALGFGTAAKSKRADMIVDYVEQVADRLYLKIVSAGEGYTPDSSTPASKDIVDLDDDE